MVGRTSKSPSLYVKEREITQHLHIYLFYIHLVTFSNINFCFSWYPFCICDSRENTSTI